MSRISFLPAAAFTLEQLADIYTRMFADYAYPIRVDADWLAQRLLPEDIDLARTPVICWDAEPVGLSVYARRDRSVNCAGFGIVPQLRGQGLSRRLLDAFLAQAQRDGTDDVTLMVLAENLPALRTYQRAGFRTTRMLEWYDGAVQHPFAAEPAAEPITDLLQAASGLAGAEPYWQSADVTLARLTGLTAWTVRRADQLAAVAFVQPPAVQGAAHVHRLLAADQAAAELVLRSVAGRWPRLSANEPADSPWHSALSAVGLPVTRRRCDMQLTFNAVG